MAIKPDWIVCNYDGPLCVGETSEPQEFKSEKAAVKRAKEWLSDSGDDECWIYRLSHVVAKPDEAEVITVK